jgi:hypothetical protein
MFETMTDPIVHKSKLIEYLAGRIEDTVFIERDPDVIMVRKDGKMQPARVTFEDKARGIVSLSLLSDKTSMVLSYTALKEMSPGSEIVAALDAWKKRQEELRG